MDAGAEGWLHYNLQVVSIFCLKRNAARQRRRTAQHYGVAPSAGHWPSPP